MEFVKGQTLEELLSTRGPFGAREAALVGLICAAPLPPCTARPDARDVKAHNVMREEGGPTYLWISARARISGSDLPAHADGGDLAGTPLYLAPEVFEGQPRTKAPTSTASGIAVSPCDPDVPVEVPRPQPSSRRTGASERTHLRDARPDLPDEFVQIVERAVAAEPTKIGERRGV